MYQNNLKSILSLKHILQQKNAITKQINLLVMAESGVIFYFLRNYDNNLTHNLLVAHR